MRNPFKERSAREFLGHGAAIFAATMFVNVAMFVFHVALSRELGVREYGVLYTLISGATFIAVLAGILTLVVARIVAEAAVTDRQDLLSLLIGSSLKRGAIASVVSAAVLLAAALPLRNFLHLTDVGPVLALAFFALTQFALAAARGVLQGLQRFSALAMSLSIEAFVRTGLAVLVGATQRSVTLAVAAYGVGALIALGYTIYAMFVVARPRFGGSGLKTGGIVRLLFGAAASTLAVAALGIVDVVLVRHYFNSTASGIYSAVSLAGKVVYLAAAFLPMIVVPKATARAVQGANASRILLPVAASIAVLSGITLVAFALAPSKIINIMTGPQYAAAAAYIFRYAIAMTLLGATSAVIAYRIALNNFSFIPATVAIVIVQAAAIALYHDSIDRVITIVIVTNALVFAAVVLRLPKTISTRAQTLQIDPMLVAKEVEGT